VTLRRYVATFEIVSVFDHKSQDHKHDFPRHRRKKPVVGHARRHLGELLVLSLLGGWALTLPASASDAGLGSGASRTATSVALDGPSASPGLGVAPAATPAATRRTQSTTAPARRTRTSSSRRAKASSPAVSTPRLAAGAGLEAAGGYWYADLAGVPLGSAGCGFESGTPTAEALNDQWNYWDNCGASVVSVADEGLPANPWNGDRVVKWHKSAGDNVNVYQKLNRAFGKGNWPNASGVTATTGSPADVSGRYIVYDYIPSARFKLNPSHGWVLLNVFKEDYYDSSGAWRQDPTWGVGCFDFNNRGVRCSLSPHQSPTFPFSDIVDRWVKWELRVYQGARDTTGHGGRIELYMDDKLVDTGYNSEKHVGSGAFAPLDRTRDWVWIAGQYTSNQTTNGVPDSQNTDVTSYVGLSAVLPLP
jgi:hypothetical protein